MKRGRSRKYNKRIAIWQIGENRVSDGFGGYTTTDALLSNSWCKISTIQAGSFKGANLTEFGIVNPERAVIVTLRKRNDLDYNSKTMYFMYRGFKYTIATAPINIDFNDYEISFVAERENKKSNA